MYAIKIQFNFIIFFKEMSQNYNNIRLHPYNTRSVGNGMERFAKWKISSKELGRGAFSKVFVATNKETNAKAAMKIVQVS
uniref:Protein kinase domain-containing protein n=1 Tax=Panagrolaimus sp. ES5 TaxID=591445 RepID=A0AC34FSG7_9BILA